MSTYYVDKAVSELLPENYDEDKIPVTVLLTALGKDAHVYQWRGNDNEAPTGGDTSFLSNYDGLFQPSDIENVIDNPDGFYVEIPYTVWGDYVGGAVERSNHRSFARDFPNVFIDATGGYWSHTLMLPLTSTVPLHLIHSIFAVKDEYPLYDEGDYSYLEMELVAEGWEEYGRHDFIRAIEEAIDKLDIDPCIFAPDPAACEQFWFKRCQDGDGSEYEVETAVSVYFRTDSLARDVARSMASLIRG